MHVRSILNVLSALVALLGFTMLLPAVCSLFYGESDLEGILISAGITLAVTLPVWFFTRGEVQLGIKDGFAIVTLTWTCVAAWRSAIHSYGCHPKYHGRILRIDVRCNDNRCLHHWKHRHTPTPVKRS